MSKLKSYRFSRDNIIQYFIALSILGMVLIALVPIIMQALSDQPLYVVEAAFTWDNYIRLFTEAAFGTVIINSFLLAIGTTVLALPIGALLAILINRVGIPGGKFFEALILIPLFISPLVVAFGFVIAYGPAGYVTSFITDNLGIPLGSLYSIPGMAITSAITLVPIVYNYCSSSLKSLDPRMEDAMRSSGGGPIRILGSVTLPLMRPALVYSGLLVFTMALEELSIPLIYGPPAGKEFFTSFIFEKGLKSSTVDYGIVGAACTLLLFILVILVIIQMLVLRNMQRFTTVRGKGAAPRKLDIGKLKWVGLAFLVLYSVIGPLIPAIGVVIRAFTSILSPLISPLEVLTFDNFIEIFEVEAYRGAIFNSVMIALVGAAAAILVTTLVVMVIRRSRFRFAKPLEFLALSPLAFPGIVLSFGLFFVFLLVPGMNIAQGTIWAVTFAFMLRSIPTAFGAISPGMMQIGLELDQASRSVGADWWRTMRSVITRLIIPVLVATYFLIFASMIREYSAAVYLSDGDSQVIGQVSLSLWDSGSTGSTAAMSFIQIVIAVSAMLIGRGLMKGKGRNA